MNDQRRDGWYNYCRRCNGRYFVRAADISNTKVRRFVDADSDERHECPV